MSKNRKLAFLDCSGNKLAKIDLKNNRGLTNLYCINNQLTNLDLSNCENLEILKAHNYYEREEWGYFNKLSDINYLNQLPNPKKLRILCLGANNIYGDLNFFSRFINLEDLYLGMNGYSEKSTKERRNKFFGSLEPLKNCTKLKQLDIDNTDINNGVEHLPESIEKVYYSISHNSTNKVEEIKWQLDSFTIRKQKKQQNFVFDWESVKSLIKAGLEPKELDFAHYLRYQNYILQPDLNLPELRKDYQENKNNSQFWLHKSYFDKEEDKVKKIDIGSKRLTGHLDLTNFTNLEILDCSNNQLISLDLSKNINLKSLNCAGNSLIEKLDLSNNLSLVELDCSNDKINNEKLTDNLLSIIVKNKSTSDSQLTDIIFSPDFESFKLERINITGNDKLDYSEIEKRFLKRLSNKLENEISPINPKELEKIILERLNVFGEIKGMQLFTTWWNPNCAIVINKVVWYAVRLVVCEPLSKGKGNEKMLLETQLESFYQELVKRENKKKYLQNELEALRENDTEKNNDINSIKEKIEISKLKTEKENNLIEISTQINKLLKKTRELKRSIKKIEMGRIFKTIKISEHIYIDKIYQKVKELKKKLNGDNPILAIYSNTGFSPSDVVKRIELPKEAKNDPDKYLKPADIVWRNMKIPVLGCYHVAVYLGDKRVVHIGSSKFIKTSKVKESKVMLGARNDHWQDFLYGSDTNRLIRYHLIIPFQRPEKIRKNIINAILAEYGQKEYSFLGHNCEHFATLAVCGIPFSTQVDKIGLLLDKVYLDLEKEIQENNSKFTEMYNLETFGKGIEKIKEYNLEKIKVLEAESKITAERQQQLTKLEEEIQELEELESQQLQIWINISDTNSEIDISNISLYSSNDSLLSSLSSTSLLNWEQIIKKKAKLLGTTEKIIPFDNNKVLVVNKVALYAIRLFEYDLKKDKLIELKRYAKNKVGYLALEDALAKIERIIEEQKLNQWKNVHSDFTKELIQQWQVNNFTVEQCCDWINAGLKPTDTKFVTWLRDTKQVNAEWLLNHGQEQGLRTEYQEYLNNQLQTNIEILSK